MSQRVAVSDGATESAYADLWAKLLATGFVDGALCPRLRRVTRVDQSGLTALRAAWWREVRTTDLPWYLEQKLEQGAHATLVGIELQYGRSPHRVPHCARARVVAVGDSCLLLLRSGSLAWRFPVESSAAFGNRPHLIGSRTNAIDPFVTLHLPRITFAEDDVVYLATDALAAYLLHQHEDGTPAWRELDDLCAAPDSAAFVQWIEQKRHQRLMRNDDVALVRVSFARDGGRPDADDAPRG